MPYKVSTVDKKSVVEKEYYVKDGKTAIIKQGYRWGYFTTDEEPDLENYDPEEGLMIYNYDVDDHSFDDGCWIEFDYDEEMTEEECEAFETAYEEDWYEGLDAAGWEAGDSEVIFYGELLVENLPKQFEDDGIEEYEK